MRASKDCLLVIDMQDYFLADKKTDDLERKLAVQAAMINSFRAQNRLTVYTVMFPKDPDLESNGIPSQISPKSVDEIVPKFYSDCFKNTELEHHLKGYHLHVVGCNAESCVKETVDSALLLGYQVTVYKNAILAIYSSQEKLEETAVYFSDRKNVRLRDFS